MHRRVSLTFCLAGVAFLSGCAPPLSPLYRDYDIEIVEAEPTTAETTSDAPADERGVVDEHVYDLLRAALAEAGWAEAEPAAPNVISTEARQLSDWGLYRVLVTLDVVPVGGQHVRVLFHPVRRYFTGGRSRIPYLDAGMRRQLLPDLNEALEVHGFPPIGTPRERDEEHVEGA